MKTINVTQEQEEIITAVLAAMAARTAKPKAVEFNTPAEHTATPVEITRATLLKDVIQARYLQCLVKHLEAAGLVTVGDLTSVTLVRLAQVPSVTPDVLIQLQNVATKLGISMRNCRFGDAYELLIQEKYQYFTNELSRSATSYVKNFENILKTVNFQNPTETNLSDLANGIQSMRARRKEVDKAKAWLDANK